ncbi:NupC/NupG family nucleoside CNT transporter [Pantanalinema sp. GBBB05]|uniref:NupC/NupG family nucleoside CNT transporter n=1 Tax=Pantanalinema sp. GBBB05 TaxID=2604139 RepID=UPI001DDC390C|nr:nucleoside:proton symporter [Pantanalinema sp. GBBB05]
MRWLNLLSFIGIFAFCGIAWLTSENRRVIPWKTLIWGIGLQLILGALVFLVPVTRLAVLMLNDGVNAILDAIEAGARFVFGNILVPNPGQVPGPTLAGRWIARAITPPYAPVPGDYLSPDNINLGYIFAFRALPSVIFFSALMSLLYALGLIQPIVNAFARIFRRTMSLSGAEALSGAANIFVGIEAMLVIRPYLARMTRSEFCAILASCFGSIASTVLALYAGFLRPEFPNITGHLVSASIMAIPACFVMAKLIVPETETPVTIDRGLEERRVTTEGTPGSETITEAPVVATKLTQDEIEPPIEKEPPQPVSEVAHEEPAPISLMESLIIGAIEGVKLAAAIAALLIAVLGLIALVNLFFANLASLINSKNYVLYNIGRAFQVITLQNILGVLFLPLTFFTGVSVQWQELWQASVLIGQRLITTEIPSYQQLGILSSQNLISDRALLVISYALCGFAHLPSVGIFVGGLVGIVPSRRQDIVDVGWKALWAATLATLMIGAVAGTFDTGNPAILGK